MRAEQNRAKQKLADSRPFLTNSAAALNLEHRSRIGQALLQLSAPSVEQKFQSESAISNKSSIVLAVDRRSIVKGDENCQWQITDLQRFLLGIDRRSTHNWIRNYQRQIGPDRRSMPSKNVVVQIGDLHVMRVKLQQQIGDQTVLCCRYYIVEVFICIFCMVPSLCVLNILACSKNLQRELINGV